MLVSLRGLTTKRTIFLDEQVLMGAPQYAWEDIAMHFMKSTAFLQEGTYFKHRLILAC